MNKVVIRIAKEEDIKDILEIYAPFVTDTAITFEYMVPSIEEFTKRTKGIMCEYPYLVAEIDGRIVGYCYASAFHGREAYRHVAETSIYIKDEAHGIGIGRALYEELEKLIVKQNVYTLYACITYTEREDEYLPKTSPQFHEHMGYKKIGSHENSGYKFDRWYSVAWYEKEIKKRPEHPEKFKRFGEIS